MKQSHGFSFAEVMFAVVILGIGFIMVASIFPVAAEQSRNTHDESIAAQLARDAFSTIQSSTTSDDYPDTLGVTKAFEDQLPLLKKVSGSMICKTDKRYAWVPFYSRNGTSNPVRVTVLIVRRWIHQTYTELDENTLSSELIPRNLGIVKSSLTVNPDGSGKIGITRDDLNAYQSITTGAFLILRNGNTDWGGTAVQVGAYLNENADAVYWQLVPGRGLDARYSYDDADQASVIGRDFADVNNPGTGYAGPAQDVSVFTTYINP